MYCVVVWQRVIGMVCVLCGGVAACYRYGVCTVWWCGSVSQVWCSSQRGLGLPIGLLDMGFHLLIFCTIISSAMHSTFVQAVA